MNRIHISLRTPEPRTTAAFYEKLLGTPPDKVHDDYVRFAPEHLPLLLSLIPGEPGVDHLGVRHDDADGLAAHLATLGLTASDEVVCCHAEKSEAWVHDPDGRSWEIYRVTDEAPERPSTDRTGCCPTTTTDASQADAGCCG